MPIVESTLGVARMRVVDQTTGLPAWVTLNAAPPVTNNVWEAADEAAMLALTVKQYDLCVRLDRNTLFYYTASAVPAVGTPTLITDWAQVSWADAQLVADQAAMLALVGTDFGDLVYDSDASELYIRLETAGTGSLITDWLKLGSRPNIHLDVADETAMLALVAEKGDLALRLDQNCTYALHTNPATDILNWIQLPGSGSAKDIWIFSANATGGVDPGLGNMTAVSDGLTPPTWTFEFSAVDTVAAAHNLEILKERDTIVITDVPGIAAAPTFFQRFEVLTEPTDNTSWYSFTAVPVDTAVGTLPAVGSEVAVDLGFGGGAIKVIDELLDVQTIGLASHPTGPVQGESLIFDEVSGLWSPSPDPHIVLESADEPVMPDGTPVPDGTIWLNPLEIVPVEPPIRVIDDLLDVDTVTIPPVQGDSLVFNANLGQWMPAVATRKFVSTLALGAVGLVPVVHNLGLTEVFVAVYVNSNQIAAGVTITDLNTVTLDFGTAATTAAATVVILG